MPNCAALLLFATIVAQTSHDKAFWRHVVEDKFAVPPGQEARVLAAELVGHLGDADPEFRDDLAFTILTAWIYDKKLLGPDDLRPLIGTLTAALEPSPPGADPDTVLRRSFSALTLSVIAARDNVTPFTTEDEFRRMLAAALRYFESERDTRGFDAQKGWVHTAAHTADLLKFLARSDRLQAADQPRILTALLEKQRRWPASFAQGEDERMARVVISIVRRPDFDRDAFRHWIDAARIAAAFPKTPTVEALRVHQNVRHLLSSLWTELSVDERPSAGADAAKQMLREALKTLF